MGEEQKGANGSSRTPWYQAGYSWLGPLAGIGVVGYFGLWVGGALVHGGLRPCERLDERICRDLGTEDCAVWKAELGRAGAAGTLPFRAGGGRYAPLRWALNAMLPGDSGVDKAACYRQLEDPLYSASLGAIRQMVAARKHARAR